MKLSARFPAGPELTAGELLAELDDEPTDGRLIVGDERIREFLTAFSRRLMNVTVARLLRAVPVSGSMEKDWSAGSPPVSTSRKLGDSKLPETK